MSAIVVAGDDTLDRDVDPVTGLTGNIVIGPNAVDDTWDVGLIPLPTAAPTPTATNTATPTPTSTRMARKIRSHCECHLTDSL